jgi:hypothetical protein
VKRLEPPYWRQQGWQRAVLDFCPGYKGYYRTLYGSYPGEIKEEDTEGYDFFILKPPEQLMNHPHWICFTYQGKDLQERDRYHIHFKKKPRDIDSGIIAIERLIRESFEGMRR